MNKQHLTFIPPPKGAKKVEPKPTLRYVTVINKDGSIFIFPDVIYVAQRLNTAVIKRLGERNFRIFDDVKEVVQTEAREG